jgi:predicted DNA-binding protein YlxM (UPF0122 family)
MRASTVWQDMLVNKLNTEEAAENFNLPLDAIHEIIRYCEANKELIKMEAQEELYQLKERGVNIES